MANRFLGRLAYLSPMAATSDLGWMRSETSRKLLEEEEEWAGGKCVCNAMNNTYISPIPKQDIVAGFGWRRAMPQLDSCAVHHSPNDMSWPLPL
eukprot:scaffold345238_cov103-Cyclotella_meneghiniana.AAC.1